MSARLRVIMLAPRECWHTEDLLSLQEYSRYEYKLIYDTPPFFTRAFYRKLPWRNVFPYERLQRIYRILALPIYSLYIFLRLIVWRQHPIHCHGLYSLILATLSLQPLHNIVFTPQGSDLLVLPYRHSLIKLFLSRVLPSISSITADSSALLDSCRTLAPSLSDQDLHLIQNGIDTSLLDSVTSTSVRFDLCWCRGLTDVYNFEYFYELLLYLSSVLNQSISVCIVGAFGFNEKILTISSLPNITLSVYDRLDKVDFFSVLASSKVVVSIPFSDSSPRTVYESIYLRRTLFLTDLACFSWIQDFQLHPHLFATHNVSVDGHNLLSLINLADQDCPSPSRSFLDALSFPKIADAFFDVYSSVYHNFRTSIT